MEGNNSHICMGFTLNSIKDQLNIFLNLIGNYFFYMAINMNNIV